MLNTMKISEDCERKSIWICGIFTFENYRSKFLPKYLEKKLIVAVILT